MVLSACAGPAQYYAGTGVHDATVAEAAGTWENIENTRLTLRRDGTASFQHLDGRNFDFDDGWRVSGTGTWKLGADGQDIRLTMTARTGAGTRSDASVVDASASAPATYRWSIHVDRDEREALALFFFIGDPDNGSTYVLRKVTAQKAPAPATPAADGESER
ncbi:hypothetical protein [Streptomyces microflavus]|uniref:hypothetical protein n=1 Tax=Streptomyces microflavus TaxID=1919 RepID=UPI00381B05AD